MIKKKLSSFANKSSIGRKTKAAYKKTIAEFYRRLTVKENQVMFESYRSSKYACSPKAIYEYMIENPEFDDYTFVWSFKNPAKYAWLVDKRTKLVKYRSWDYFKAAASSQSWEHKAT